MASGVVPQISVIMGPCAGGAVYSPAMTDFIIMVRESSYMFITGPDVIRATTHEEVSMQDLGGADTHSQQSGVCHLEANDDQGALMMIREMLSYMPSNNAEDPPFRASKDDPERRDSELDSMVPENPNKPYDMVELIRRVVDDGHFLEIQKDWANNMLIGFARIGGYSVGVVANQPAYLAGCLDIDASVKARALRAVLRLLQHSDCHVCRCARISAGHRAGVPGHHSPWREAALRVLRGDRAESHRHHAQGLRRRVRRDVIEAHSRRFQLRVSDRRDRGDGTGPGNQHSLSRQSECAAERTALTEDYRKTFANPFKAAELGYVDEVIMPRDTRPRVIAAFKALENKVDKNPPKKHGNIPL